MWIYCQSIQQIKIKNVPIFPRLTDNNPIKTIAIWSPPSGFRCQLSVCELHFLLHFLEELLGSVLNLETLHACSSHGLFFFSVGFCTHKQMDTHTCRVMTLHHNICFFLPFHEDLKYMVELSLTLQSPTLKLSTTLNGERFSNPKFDSF